MAFDAFLKIDGIPGESTDAKHKDWIEVLSYGWTVRQDASVSASKSTGGARTSGRTDHSDFVMSKALDKASPKLFLHVCNGKHIPKVELHLNRATGDKQVYMKYVMEDCIVSSFQTGGSAQGGDAVPTESISFNYGKITLTYTETDHKTGKPGGNVEANWSLVENKGG